MEQAGIEPGYNCSANNHSNCQTIAMINFSVAALRLLIANRINNFLSSNVTSDVAVINLCEPGIANLSLVTLLFAALWLCCLDRWKAITRVSKVLSFQTGLQIFWQMAPLMREIFLAGDLQKLDNQK